MIRAFFSGKEGLRAHQTAMDSISNNVANVNTTGFKSKTTQFSDVLYSSMVRPDNPAYATQLTGNGVATASVENDMTKGTPYATDSKLDYCPSGDGFFAVQNTAGKIYYTRDGSFSVKVGANGLTLQNAQGLYVLDSAGNHIGIDNSGEPTAEPGVYDFSNSQGLLNAGGNLFTQSDTSGDPAVSAEGVKRAYLEGSNVDLSQEMTKLIITQRGYQLNSSVVQTANQIETMTNDLKG